jgi:tetratricopeptide (TPR) repeat protein
MTSTRPLAPLVVALALSLAALAAAPPPATAQAGVSGEDGTARVEGLGTVRFPSSGAPEARPHFLRGLLLLHSFEYADARQAFRRAREVDPDYAMAYWGEAMTHDHPLWRQQDRAAAREVLRALAPSPGERRAKAGTEREAAYLGAAEVLFGDGPAARRDTAYSRAMRRIVARFPGDDEARAFYALSLLGLEQGERDVPTFMRAGAIALQLFREHPRHPGAVHYAIHAFDDPDHAPLGLEAARAYSDIAPDAAHARHMTSHIFLALGMWEEVVAANEAAARAVGEDAGHGFELHPCGHYAEWLAYGYLQRGRPDDAGELIRRCHRLATGNDDRRALGSVARMRALYLVDTGRRDGEVAALRLDAGEMAPRWRLARDFGDALAAARRGELEAARAALATLEAREEGLREGLAADLRVLAHTLRAVIAEQAGDPTGALEHVRRAAELAARQPTPYGPPSTYLPPRELEGRLLLELDRPSEARTAFAKALRRTPRRVPTLLGAARAADAADAPGEAARHYAMVEEIRSAAGEGDEARAEARRFLEEHGRPDAVPAEPVALP